MNLHVGELGEPDREVITPRPPGLVFVQKDDDLAVAVGVFANQILLRLGHGAAHEGNDLAEAHLVKLHATEEAFDNDE